MAMGMSSGNVNLGRVDDQMIQYVYDRYIGMLQQDKNATIESILREEPIAMQISNQLIMSPQGKVISGYTEKDIE